MWGGGGGLGMTGWRGRCWGTGRGGVRKKTLRNARHHPHAVATTAVRQGSHTAVASRRRQFPSDMCWCYRHAHTPRPPDGAVDSTTGTAQGGDAAVHRHRVGGCARQWYGSVKATYVAGARLGGKRPEKARSKPYRGGGYRDAGGGGRPTAPPTAKRGPTARNWNCRGSRTRARATPLTRVATTWTGKTRCPRRQQQPLRPPPTPARLPREPCRRCCRRHHHRPVPSRRARRPPPVAATAAAATATLAAAAAAAAAATTSPAASTRDPVGDAGNPSRQPPPPPPAASWPHQAAAALPPSASQVVRPALGRPTQG